MKRPIYPLVFAFAMVFGTGAMAAALAAGGPLEVLRGATDDALAAERAAVDERLSGLEQALSAAEVYASDLEASLEAVSAERDALQAELDALQGPQCDVTATTIADITGAAQGATVCAPGAAFVTANTITIPQGVTLVGPMSFEGQNMGQSEDLLRAEKNVTLLDVTAQGAGRHGLACDIGTTVIGGRYHHNGKDGIGCDLEGYESRILLQDVELDHNGSSYWLGKGAAGAKFFHAHGVTIANAYVHDNVGNGLWCDAQCGDFTVTGSIVTGNTRKGLFYEKGGESDGSFLGRTWAIYTGTFVATGNTIVGNDLDGSPSANAGVSIYSSKNALISGNIFDGQARAIIAREDAARLTDDKHGWPLENITLGPNEVRSGEVVGCGSSGVTCV